jgi:hypothetical protein
MVRRWSVALALIALVAIGWVLWPRPAAAPVPPAAPSPAVAPAMTPRPLAAPVAPAPVRIEATEVAAAPEPSPPAAPAAEPMHEAPVPAPAPAAVSADVIHGASPVPRTGKPDAPVDVDWDLRPDPAALGTFRGTIGATNRGGPLMVRIDVRPLGDLAIIGPVEGVAQAAERGMRVERAVGVALTAGGGKASLLVSVAMQGATTWTRVVAIPIRADPADAQAKPGEGAKSPPAGEEVIRDATGQDVHFMPATP